MKSGTLGIKDRSVVNGIVVVVLIAAGNVAVHLVMSYVLVCCIMTWICIEFTVV